jgi:hypothetical protein
MGNGGGFRGKLKHRLDVTATLLAERVLMNWFSALIQQGFGCPTQSCQRNNKTGQRWCAARSPMRCFWVFNRQSPSAGGAPLR